MSILSVGIFVGTYALQVLSIAIDAGIMKAVWTRMWYTLLLCFTLFQTGSLSESAFLTRVKSSRSLALLFAIAYIVSVSSASTAGYASILNPNENEDCAP